MNYFLFGLPLLVVLSLFSTQDIMNQDKGEMHFENLIISRDISKHSDALSYIQKNWDASFLGLAIELSYLSKDRHITDNLLAIVVDKTGINFGYEYSKWYELLWSKEQNIPPYYHRLKALMHKGIDRRFEKYFLDRQDEAEIRLDEIRWGGVVQDGIPPLRNPAMINADEASYLEDDHIVFGIEINGDFRAYPKRILAWHEMFTDEVGGVKVAGVYCTLCGTVILYQTEKDGTSYTIGTSGFLFRSNKLMYDKATQSLWNTVWGRPVVGPLVGKGIELDYLSTVTTTWGEWKKLHPETMVLDINTGHRRDYGEGVAYQSYFATDKLMFNVPNIDTSLKNKQSILAIKIQNDNDESIAISVDFLKDNPIYSDAIGKVTFTVFTDYTGANRVFRTTGQKFVSYDRDTGVVRDSTGDRWKVAEDGLYIDDVKQLDRLHTFNAFWFGWKAAYPDTRLIK